MSEMFEGMSNYARQVLQTSVSPDEIAENNQDLELALDSISELESFLSEDGEATVCYEELTTPFAKNVAKLLKELNNLNVTIPISHDKLISWIVIEILNTGIDHSDLASWLNHDATLDEILFGVKADDTDNVLFFLKKGQYSIVRKRYNEQYKKLNFLKQKK